MEDGGADLDNSHAVFVGGTFYGQNFKGEYPESEVTVVEADPISAYMQSFAGYQLQEGYTANEIEEMMLRIEKNHDNPGGKSSLQTFVEIPESKYNWIKERHKEFLNSEWCQVDEDIIDSILFEPDYSSEEFYQGFELDKEFKESLFQSILDDNHYERRSSRPKRAKQKIKSAIPIESEVERINKASSEIYEEIINDSIPEKSEIENILTEHEINYSAEHLDDIKQESEFLVEKSHYEHAEETGAYSIITEKEDGGRKVRLNHDRSDFSVNWKALDKADTLKPVDSLLLEDVRNTNLEGDIVFTNNVFDYLDPEEITQAVNSLSAEQGSYLETVSINYGGSTHNQEEIEQSDRVEILAEAPSVNFHWGENPEGEREEPYEGVRLFQPAQGA